MDLTSPKTRAFWTYWQGLKQRSPSKVPLKSDFDPADIKPLLPHMVFHDLGIPGKSILRVIGTLMAERMGQDPTGRDYLEFVDPERRQSAYNHLYRTATHPCGMLVRILGEYRSGQLREAETLGLPFVGDNDRPFMMFIDDELESETYMAPRRDQPLVRYTVPGRTYLDIGYGVPPMED